MLWLFLAQINPTAPLRNPENPTTFSETGISPLAMAFLVNATPRHCTKRVFANVT